MRSWKTLAALMTFSLTESCVAAPVCVTRCGLEVVTELPAGWSCDAVQRTEDAAMSEFKAVKDPRLPNCKVLNGVTVEFKKTRAWLFDGREVYGLSWCSGRTIELGNAEPSGSSMAHEFAHIMQNCSPRGPVPGDPKLREHAYWDVDGIYEAIELVKAWFQK